MKASIIDFLTKARLFNVLPGKVISELAERAEWHNFEADVVAFYQGDEADRLYVIMSGEVAIETVSSEGRVVSIASLSVGDVFGEMAVLDSGKRSANVRTLRQTGMISFGKSTFLRLLEEHSEFSMQVIRDLVKRLRDTDTQIEAITLLPLKSRLAALLLDLSSADGDSIKITQSDLAERLSATREKVNVNLQTLRALGAVSIGRGRLDILDRAALKRVATST
jgi:CRP-like cAMP-binding protein